MILTSPLTTTKERIIIVWNTAYLIVKFTNLFNVKKNVDALEKKGVLYCHTTVQGKGKLESS